MASDEKKETEELLAGFDRPSRGRQKTDSGRDFVAYYTKPKSKKDDPHERPTVVVPRKKPWRTTLVWASAAAAMLLFGTVIAVLATPFEQHAAPTAAPSSATTITSATAEPTTEEPATTIPVVVDVPAAQKKPAPATIKPLHRDDYLRDM